MLTISKPLSAGQAAAYHASELTPTGNLMDTTSAMGVAAVWRS
jgi:hypothetical protein